MVKIGFIDHSGVGDGDERFNKLKNEIYAKSELDLVVHWISIEEFTKSMEESGSSVLDTLQRVVIFDSAFSNINDTNYSVQELVKLQQVLSKANVAVKVVLLLSRVDIFDTIKSRPDLYMLYKNFLITKTTKDEEGRMLTKSIDGVFFGTSDNTAFSISTPFRDEKSKIQENAKKLKTGLGKNGGLKEKLRKIQESEKLEKEKKLKEKQEKSDLIKKDLSEKAIKTSKSSLELISDEFIVANSKFENKEKTLSYRGKLLKDRGYILTFGDGSATWMRRLFASALTYSELGLKVLFVNATNSFDWESYEELNPHDYSPLLDNKKNIDKFDFNKKGQMDIYSCKDYSSSIKLVKYFYDLEILNKYNIIYINMVSSDLENYLESISNPVIPSQIILYSQDEESSSNMLSKRTFPVVKFSGVKSPIMLLYNEKSSSKNDLAEKVDSTLYRGSISFMKNMFLGGINYGK